jgi:hypothetical protein
VGAVEEWIRGSSWRSGGVRAAGGVDELDQLEEWMSGSSWRSG